MSRTTQDKIQDIISARRPKAERADDIHAMLEDVKPDLNNLERLSESFETRPDLAARKDSFAKIAFEAKAAKGKIEDLQSKASLLSSRFSRPTLNLGVVGRARQGKSTFLCSLTGLTAEEIPTGDTDHCTGAPSCIENKSVEDAYAEVEFHTEDSFLSDVVRPFFDELGLPGAPTSLSAFQDHPLELPPKDSKTDGDAATNAEGETTRKTKLEQLKIRQKYLRDYQPMLGESRKRVGRDEIIKYVARQDSSKRSLYSWIAVKMVHVFCKFPQASVNSLLLLDTPGLGDFVSGAEERLVRMVGENLDGILFLRMPPRTGAIAEAQDTNLYDLISRSLKPLEVKDWAYYVINRFDQPDHQLEFFKKQLKEKNQLTRREIIVNCSDPADSAGCLNKILDDLASVLPSLDQQLINELEREWSETKQSIQGLIKSARDALPVSVVQPDEALLTKLLNELWDNLADKFGELLSRYRSEKNQEDKAFQETLKEIFEQLDPQKLLPPVETIEREAKAPGLAKWHPEKLHELRVKFASEFDRLDSCFDSSFEELRASVRQVLLSEEGGRGTFLASGRSDEDFWRDFGDLVSKYQEYSGCTSMREAIDRLAAARLSFRGFIQPRIRDCFDVLDSASDQSKAFAYSPGDKESVVREKLSVACDRAIFMIRSKIEPIATEPSMARFAALEDFVDAFLHSGGESVAKDFWKAVYRENRGEVWPEKFRALESETRLRRDWNEALNKLSERIVTDEPSNQQA